MHFQDPLQMYWYFYDCLYNAWLGTFVGSREAEILDADMIYVQSLIETLQQPEDRRRVKKLVISGHVCYDLIDPNIDEDGFLIGEAENTDDDTTLFYGMPEQQV